MQINCMGGHSCQGHLGSLALRGKRNDKRRTAETSCTKYTATPKHRHVSGQSKATLASTRCLGPDCEPHVPMRQVLLCRPVIGLPTAGGFIAPASAVSWYCYTCKLYTTRAVVRKIHDAKSPLPSQAGAHSVELSEVHREFVANAPMASECSILMSTPTDVYMWTRVP